MAMKGAPEAVNAVSSLRGKTASLVYYNLAHSGVCADEGLRDTEMGAENFQNSAAGNRAAKRARVLLAARLQTSFGEVEARLRDLSRKGALLECPQAPNVGSSVVFIRGETVVNARVAWAAGSRVGIEFDRMIDEQELLIHIGKPPRQSSQTAYPQSYRRPGIGRMSVEDHKVAQAWSIAVGLTLPEDRS